MKSVQIIGVPDDRFGEVVCAWIRLKHGQIANQEEIREYCKGKVLYYMSTCNFRISGQKHKFYLFKIAHFKIPKYILFKETTEFPMTVTGRIHRFKDIFQLFLTQFRQNQKVRNAGDLKARIGAGND
jgi:acyl-CoA synthetase (AMP-forming)/AMP-acid ligase II